MHRSVISGSSKKCLEQLKGVMCNELKLKKDQVVSISIHDSRVHHGDLEAVLFYKSESTSPDSEPIEDSLDFTLVERDEDTEWDVIMGEINVNANSPGRQTLGVGATFRNVGEEKIACIYSVQGISQGITAKQFSRKTDWNDLLNEAERFLNEYIPPQNFHSVVLFEEEHPLEEREAAKGVRTVIVYHTVQELAPIKDDLD